VPPPLLVLPEAPPVLEPPEEPPVLEAPSESDPPDPPVLVAPSCCLGLNGCDVPSSQPVLMKEQRTAAAK
jgi:hypothetical protein